jgi:pimeloyl-ACP methyl ester carboxylesterase
VVFVPGAGMTGPGYLNVHDRVSQFTTSVLYDRAGTGWSDGVPLPRSATVVADEVRELLRVAGVPAPYLLVGHSLGGLYAHRFTQRFPDEVAALLLLDPAHEAYAVHMPKPTLGEVLRTSVGMVRVLLQFKRLHRGLFERMFAGWPDSVRGPLVDYHLRSWRKGVQEVRNLESQLYGEVRRGGRTPDVPLIVLTGMGMDRFRAVFTPEPYIRRINDAKRVINAAVAASVPRGEHRVLEDAAHSTFHTDRPDAVVQAIRDQVSRVSGDGH